MIEDSFFGTELHRTLKTSGGDCPFPTVGESLSFRHLSCCWHLSVIGLGFLLLFCKARDRLHNLQSLGCKGIVGYCCLLFKRVPARAVDVLTLAHQHKLSGQVPSRFVSSRQWPHRTREITIEH